MQHGADAPLESNIEFVLDAGECKAPPLGEVIDEGGIFQEKGQLTPRPVVPSLKKIFQSLVAQERGDRIQRIRTRVWRLLCFLVFALFAAAMVQLSISMIDRYTFRNNPANFVEREHTILGGAAMLEQRVQTTPYRDGKTVVEPFWRLVIAGEVDEVIQVQLLDADGRNASGGVWEFAGSEQQRLKPFRYHRSADQWLFSFKGEVRQQLVPVLHPWDRWQQSGR